MFNQTDIAYLAGLFDGEGSISILKNKLERDQYARHPRFDLATSISNQNFEVLCFAKTLFGGSLLKGPATYQWRLASNKALFFLETVRPYIKIKRVQLELGIAFQTYKRQRTPRFRLTEEEIDIYESYHKKMQELNKQGSLVFHTESGELQEHPTLRSFKNLNGNIVEQIRQVLQEDNLQPSSSNEIDKVDEKVHRLTGEESQSNKPDTSARPERDDIVGTA